MKHLAKFHAGSLRRSLIVLSAVTCAALLVDATGIDAASDGPTRFSVSDRGWLGDDGPHLLEGDVADVIVPLFGGLCSGTPIAGTPYVVTAAHCVLTDSGDVRQRSVVRDGVVYRSTSVFVDTRYHDNPIVELDAAVLVLEEIIPGPSAQLGLALPESGWVTLAGFQPIDEHGALVRPDETTGQTAPKPGVGRPVDEAIHPAGCVESVQSLTVTAVRVTVPCGLVPGASGGPLLAIDNGELVLVGILSTVANQYTTNGVVPLDSLHELLAHPEQYEHDFANGQSDNRSPDAIDHAEL